MATAAALWDDLLEGEEIAYLGEEPARGPRLAPFPDEVDPRVRAAVGLDALYAHQREAWDAAARGEHLIVTTGTASGKTLAFNLPVLDALAREPKLRALYLYPTKALAQDQARTLHSYRIPRLRPAIYDGDTESERRWQIRRWANLILTNPDMLHVGVLPHHDRWGDVLSNLPSSSSTRRTSIAACSARTSRTSSGGCVASPRSTARSRSSCSLRQRSRTPASSLSGCSD